MQVIKRANERKLGAAMSLAATGVNGILGLAYVPVLLQFLTGSEYGVYELVGSLIGYMSVLDLGFSTTLTRFCVRERAKGLQAERNLLAMAGVVYTIITVGAVIVGIVSNELLDPLLSGGFTAEELELTHRLMTLVIINCAIVLPGNYFLSIINSYERFIFARALLLVRYLLQFAGVVSFLVLGFSAFGAVMAQVLANFVTVIASAYFCFAKLDVRPKLIQWNMSLIKELISFSVFVLLGLLFNQVFLKTGQVILGAVSGTFAVGVYSLSCKITSFYIQVANSMSTVFLPQLTELVMRGNHEREINAIFVKVGKVQAALVWGVLVAFVLLGQEFVAIWAGQQYGEMYLVTIVLMLGFSVDLVQNLGIQLLQATNRLAFRNVVLTAVCIFDIVLSVSVAPHYGPLGCAVVTATLMFAASGPIMNVYYAKYANIDIPSFWANLTPEMLRLVGTGAICMLLYLFIPNAGGMTAFIQKVVIFLVIYSLMHLPLIKQLFGKSAKRG